MVTKKPTTKLTYLDYEKTSDDERYELINGELIAMAPAPDRDRQRTSYNLSGLTFIFQGHADLGRFYPALRDVYLTDRDILQPDLLFISSERLEIDTGSHVRGAPDLVVEILSPSTADRDWTVKRDLYARHGVREYWVVDTVARTITILVLIDATLEIANVLAQGDTIVSSVLVGFTPAVSDIFRGLA